jgi:hypothetical protein
MSELATVQATIGRGTAAARLDLSGGTASQARTPVQHCAFPSPIIF